MNPQRTGNWSFSVHRWGQEFLIHTHIYPRKLLYQIKPWPLVFGTILCNGPTSWFLMGRAAKAVMSNKFLASHPPSRNDGRLLDEYGAWGTSKYVRPTCPTSMHTYTYILYRERERVQCVYIYMYDILYNYMYIHHQPTFTNFTSDQKPSQLRRRASNTSLFLHLPEPWHLQSHHFHLAFQQEGPCIAAARCKRCQYLARYGARSCCWSRWCGVMFISPLGLRENLQETRGFNRHLGVFVYLFL